jgi:Mrp family chromosome partitioning ATPase
VTTVTAQLARAAVDAGQQGVLVIEAHGTPPRVSARLSAQASPGWSDAPGNVASVTDCVQTTEQGVSVLSLGSAAGASLSVEALWRALTELRGSYGLVLLDLPPAGESAAACALAARLDGVLLVIEAESTSAAAAQRVKDRLEGGGARILGVVLNKTREYLPAWLDRRLP